MPFPESLFQTKHKSFKSIVSEFVTLKDYKNIEVEARIGKITNKITKKRIDFRIDHPIIFENLPNEYCFESGVDEKDFLKIKNLLVGDVTLTQIADKVTVCNKIRKIESLFDSNSIYFQKKEKIKTLEIYLPDLKYDVRISVSMENELPAKDFIPSKTQICRQRRRESVSIGPFSLDFTKISKMGEKESKSFEVEFEIKDFDNSLTDFSQIVFSLPMLKIESNSTKR